jgi:hypothetical protein
LREKLSGWRRSDNSTKRTEENVKTDTLSDLV